MSRQHCCNNECHQGRDCPARVAKVGKRMHAASPLMPMARHRYLKEVARALLLVTLTLLSGALSILFLS